MWWNRIIAWFSELSEKQRCVNDFNRAAKEAFIYGSVPVYMKADISRGNRAYRHNMSSFLFSGFRIRTVSGRFLTREEIEAVGATISSNATLMRKLVTLGFDTLEIYSPEGSLVKDWRLMGIMQIQ